METLYREFAGRRSLSTLVAWSAALVIAAAMAVYAFIQHAADPDRGAAALVLEHAWHVLVLGLLIYFVLYLVLRRKVVDPVHDLYVKCYAVALGDLTPVSLETNIAEIRDVADGMNLMIERMERLKDEASLSDLSRQTHDLRSTIRKAGSLDEPTKEVLMGIAEKIDHTVAGLSAGSLAEGGTSG